MSRMIGTLFAAALCSGVLAVPVVTASPALAVGCSDTGCDNKGPSGNGCFADQKTLGSGDGGNIQLRYSPACHAMWAYGPFSPNFWDAELSIEMQHLNNNNQWVNASPPRLTTVFEAQGPADWTNALGSRSGNYRFRALINYEQGEPTYSTPWGFGGNR